MDRRLPALGLLVLLALLYPDAIFGSGVFFHRDIHWVWYPRIESMVRGVSEGAWPLWDPSQDFGLPALADPSYQIAYPLTWLNLVLRPAAYYKVYVFAHTFGAGLGLCFLSRAWGLSRLSAFFAGAAWAASGPVLSTVSVLHHFAGLAWIPWVLLALETALLRRSTTSTLVFGAALAGQILAGSGDMCLMTGLLALARIVVFVLAPRTSSRAGAARHVARLAAIAGTWALLLSAVQWLPTAALLREGSRLAMPPENNMFWSLHPACLADLVVPGLVTDFPMNDAVRESLFEGREPFLASVHLGAGVCTLALLGLAGSRRRLAVLAGLGGLAYLVFALGRFTPVYPVLVRMPPFAVLRYPVKYMIPVSLCAALLSGLGLEVWLRGWSRGEKRSAAVAAAACLLLGLTAAVAAEWLRLRPDGPACFLEPGGSALATEVTRLRPFAVLALVLTLLLWLRRAWSSPPHWLTAALVAVCLGEIVTSGQRVNGLAPPQVEAYRPPWAAGLRRAPWPDRLYLAPFHWGVQYDLMRGKAGSGSDWLWTLGLQDVMAPPIGGRWGFSGSYDGDFTGLAPRPLAALTEIVRHSLGRPLALRLLQMGSVDRLVSLEEQRWLGAEPQLQSSVFPAPVRIYPVPAPLPRAYAVSGVRVAPEPASYAMLGDAAFEPRREMILAQGVPRPPLSGFSGTARLIWRRADALAIEADLNAPGYVVVVEAYQEGWRATVDGERSEVLRANVLFRAVRVPQGRHRIEMLYRPSSAILGGAASGVSAALGLALWTWRGTRRSATEPRG